MMLYHIRAYSSRAVGESGRCAPLDTCQTGDFISAEKFARDAAQDYGAAVIENTETGKRTWFE
jgi:hypothetical protein